MSDVLLPPNEDVISICLADVRSVPYPVFASVAAMGESIAADWDLLALSDDDDEEDDEDPPCDLCGHTHAHKHRIMQIWGGNPRALAVGGSPLRLDLG